MHKTICKEFGENGALVIVVQRMMRKRKEVEEAFGEEVVVDSGTMVSVVKLRVRARSSVQRN